MTRKSWTYKDAGVDIEAGKKAVEDIRRLVQRTNRVEVISDIGGFGGLFSLAKEKYDQPVLVSSSDGVGTKIKIAQELGKHDTVGIDLVAMCVNDVLAMGAEPLFFMDYIACDRVKPHIITEIVKGISDGCIEAGCALLGGETAEMPDLYEPDTYDLAGFAVGIIEKEKIIDGSRINDSDVIIGLPSSGLHSNGFSLVRKLFPSPKEEEGLALLNPTRIYVKLVLALIDEFDIHALAHITGGGLIENIERLLPADLEASINFNEIRPPEVFDMIQKKGNIDDMEMMKVFNMGIGMVVVASLEELDEIKELLSSMQEAFSVLGSIKKGKGNIVFV